MFPVLTVEVSGLEPEARYFVLMEICLSSDRRYKFVGREWKATGKAELQLPRNARVFIHQESPATGSHWMREPIKMKSAKLTNNSLNRTGHVSFRPVCVEAIGKAISCCTTRELHHCTTSEHEHKFHRYCSSRKADSCSANLKNLYLLWSRSFVTVFTGTW